MLYDDMYCNVKLCLIKVSLSLENGKHKDVNAIHCTDMNKKSLRRRIVRVFEVLEILVDIHQIGKASNFI